MSIYVCDFIYNEWEPRFVFVRGGFVFKIGYPVMSVLFYLSEARTARRVGAGIV